MTRKKETLEELFRRAKKAGVKYMEIQGFHLVRPAVQLEDLRIDGLVVVNEGDGWRDAFSRALAAFEKEKEDER